MPSKATDHIVALDAVYPSFISMAVTHWSSSRSRPCGPSLSKDDRQRLGWTNKNVSIPGRISQTKRSHPRAGNGQVQANQIREVQALSSIILSMCLSKCQKEGHPPPLQLRTSGCSWAGYDAYIRHEPTELRVLHWALECEGCGIYPPEKLRSTKDKTWCMPM